jgi:hypothetical protein
MSVRHLLFAGALSMLAACSDTTGPNADVGKKPPVQIGPTSQPTGGGQTGVGHPTPVK